MRFFKDLWGSLTAGAFYRDISSKSSKQAWGYYLLLLVLIAVIMCLFYGIKSTIMVRQGLEFFAANVKKGVEIDAGRIVNMPRSHKELRFDSWQIYIDTFYTDENAIAGDAEYARPPALFVGPRKAFVMIKRQLVDIDYPESFSGKIDIDLLHRYAKYAIILSFAGGLLLTFILDFIIGLLYITLIISPILLFKFRRLALSYGEAFKAGFYIITLQLVLSTFLMVFGLTVPWSYLWYILLYVLYIGAFVNIETTRQLRS